MGFTNGVNCANSGDTFEINFNNNTVALGDYWSISKTIPPNNTTVINCVEITNATDISASTISAYTEYSTCLECLQNNRCYIILEPCIGVGKLRFIVYFDQLSIIPELGDVFYTSLVLMSPGGGLYEGCFRVASVGKCSSIEEYNKVINSGGYATIYPGATLSAQTNCESCLSATSPTYFVQRCNDGVSFRLQLPTNLIGNIISFESGGEEYCGYVKGTIFGSINSTFIFDYGKEVKCETCLENVSQKTLIRNCLDSDDTIVVWSSSLYGSGEVSNLSPKSGGCYEVVGPTTSAVTVSTYFDYDPSPTCDSCISCYGLRYEFEACEGLTPAPTYFFSHQLLTIDEVFVHPVLGSCCKITKVEALAISSPFFSSVNSFGLSGCTNCLTASTDFYYYKTSICGVDNPSVILNIKISSVNPLSLNDVVRITKGDYEFLCVKVNAITTVNDFDFVFDTVRDSLGETIIYNDCVECLSNTLLGVTMIHCQSGVQKYVSINQLDWITLTGIDFFETGSPVFLPFPIMKLENGECYVLENSCIIPLSETTDYFEATEFYILCESCVEPDIPARSANTETLLCEQICVSGGTGGFVVVEVVPPHPVWTDAQGIAVIQMNAVALGGMYGLNN